MNTHIKIATVSAVALGILVSSALPSYAGKWANHHPRRAEVLGRDANLNARLCNNKGNLGGHYGQLKAEDRAIRRQEQRYARFNGGHITKAEKERLNHEENHLSHQIKRDKN